MVVVVSAGNRFSFSSIEWKYPLDSASSESVPNSLTEPFSSTKILKQLFMRKDELTHVISSNFDNLHNSIPFHTEL